MTVSEAGREIRVRAAVDVLVCGGGLGGVSAAVAAARAGARTLLVERNGFLGGTATAGMVCSIFNCFYTSDGRPATTGIPVEIADALATVTGYGEKWRRHKGHIIFDLEQGKLVLETLVEESGAGMLVDTIVSDAVMDGDTLKGVVIESKSGREAILARVVVDATGDADVAARCGAPLHVRESGSHSYCFRMGGVDLDRFVQYLRDNPGEYPEYMDVDWGLDEVLAQYDDCGTLLFPHGGGMQMKAFRQAKENGDLPERIGMHDELAACQMHGLRDSGIMHVITGFVHFDGLDIDKLTRSIHDGRRMVFVMADLYREYMPGFENSFVVGAADDLGVRASRYLDGDFVFTGKMQVAGSRAEDAIGRALTSDYVFKHGGEGAWGVSVPRDDSFDIPYRCLLPRKVEGLIMGAGRSISAEDPWALRVMVHTMAVGQGAGTAAAVAARSGCAPRSVDIAAVQAELTRQGVDLTRPPI